MREKEGELVGRVRRTSALASRSLCLLERSLSLTRLYFPPPPLIPHLPMPFGDVLSSLSVSSQENVRPLRAERFTLATAMSPMLTTRPGAELAPTVFVVWIVVAMHAHARTVLSVSILHAWDGRERPQLHLCVTWVRQLAYNDTAEKFLGD